MFYTIYKTTNIITKEIYVGQHITKNLDDKYIGSGTRFRNSVNKYGVENFSKEIIYVFNNFDDMNNKEIEIVNEDFIKRKDTLNILLGGTNFNTSGFVTARLKGNTVYELVDSDMYAANKKSYETPTSDTMLIVENDKVIRIKCSEYDKDVHKTPSSGYVSVYFSDNTSGKILLEDFDTNKHKKVFGGIVGIKNGKKQYVSKEDIENGIAISNTKNKVTAIIIETGEIKHIEKEEFHKNRHLYKHNTEGYVTGRHKITGKKKQFLTSEMNKEIKKEYSFSTSGQRTVFNKDTNKFENILLENFDKNKHIFSTSIKFKCYKDEVEIFEYWGLKSDFFEMYNFPNTVWEIIKKEGVWNTNRKKGSEYNGCRFELIDWKIDLKIKD